MTIDAVPEFDQVQAQYEADSDPILQLLQQVADDAKEAVIGADGVATQISFLNIDTEADTSVSSLITDPTAPTEPTQEDILTLATDHLDWLKTEAIAAATFPNYTELEEIAPTTPTLDTSDPTLYEISEVAPPVYDVPVWDDTSAWSGGDLATDATLDPVTAPFTWSADTYASSLLVLGANVLYDAIKTDIQDSSYGVDQLDGGLVYDRAVERETRTVTAEAGDAIRMFAAGGFSMPTGAAAAHLIRMQNEKRDRIANMNRDVLIQKSALYLEAKKVAQANGLQIETLEQGFFNATEDRLLRAAAQEITSTVEVATFNVERIRIHIEKYVAFSRVFAEQVSAAKGVVDLYSAEVGAEKTKADVNRTLIDNLIAKNKNLIDNYIAEIDGFKSVMDGRVRYHNVLADVYKSQVSNYNKHMEATERAYDLVDKQHKTKVEFALGKYSGETAAAKVKLDEINGFLALKIDQLKAQLQGSASVAAAAMSALNVNLGLSLGASTSISGSESHQYDETKGQDPGTITTNSHSWDETKSTNPGTVTSEITYDGGTDNTNENTNYNYQGEV